MITYKRLCVEGELLSVGHTGMALYHEVYLLNGIVYKAFLIHPGICIGIFVVRDPLPA